MEIEEGYKFEDSKNETSSFLANVSKAAEKVSPFILIGKVPDGLPDFKVPPFGYDKDGQHVSFVTMISDLGVNLMVLPLIAILENIAVCKAFCKFLIIHNLFLN